MAALVLKQIERGSVTFVTSDVTKTITLSTTLTDTTKTRLLFSARSASADPINYQVLGCVLSTTQIQFERAATPNENCTVEYQVVEFTQGITVQHLYFSQSSTTINTTITAVDLAKTFVTVTCKSAGATLGTDDFVMAEITTTTNLQTTVDTAGSMVVAAQIIQIDDASVQKITGTYGTGQTKDLTVTAITENKTFWLCSFRDPDDTAIDQLPYLSYINSTTLRFSRLGTPPIANYSYVVYVVSLSSGITVQNIATTILSGDASVTPTITSVTVANTALLINGFYQRWGTVQMAGDDAEYSMATVSNLTATAFTATRAASPAKDAIFNIQVLEFSTTSTVTIFEPRATGRGIMRGVGRGIM